MMRLTGWRAVVVMVLLAAAESFTVRWLVGGHGVGGVTPSPSTPVTLAFWPLIGLVVGWIWTGVQVAAKVTLTALSWSVNVLWAFARSVANAGIAIGKSLISATRSLWDALKFTYTDILKPAWDQFWRFIDWAKRTLQNIFEPVFQFLDKIRGYVLQFYEDYVRPVLDIIDVTRRFLRVLAALGIEWARTLERKLAELEARIELPFRLVLSAINEIVNIVNRVVTADGLFQRLAYVRTLERDIVYAVRVFNNSQSKPLTDDERRTAVDGVVYKSGAAVLNETRVYVGTGQGPRASSVDEWTTHLRVRLGL